MEKKEVKVIFDCNWTDIIIIVLVFLISVCYIYYSDNTTSRTIQQASNDKARTEIIHEHNQALSTAQINKLK